MKRKRVLILAISAVVFLALFSLVLGFANLNASENDRSSSPRPRVLQSAGPNDAAQEDGFESVYIDVDFDYPSSQERFDAVSLCLYEESGMLVTSKKLGSFKAPHAGTNVSISTTDGPKYLLVYHPAWKELDFLSWQVLVVDYNSSYNDGGTSFKSGYPDSLPFSLDRGKYDRCP